MLNGVPKNRLGLLRHTVGRFAPSFALQAHHITAIKKKILARFYPNFHFVKTSLNHIC